MIRTFLTIFLFVIGSNTFAAGDPAAGKQKSGICVTCHGSDGNSVNPQWPSIAGQHPHYLERQMTAIKSGQHRQSPLMAPMVATMTEQDFADLAAYYASIPRRGTMADEQSIGLILLGEALYRGGNKERGTPACMGCHGPDGAGNNLAGFPMISEQHATYTAQQLEAFRDGTRTTDPQNMMQDIAGKLSDEEIRAVSEYLAGLRSQ